jgi:hypothetical protein
MATKLNIECHKQTEIATRYMEVLGSVMSQLPPQVQQSVKEQLERAQHQIAVAYDEQLRRLPALAPNFPPDPHEVQRFYFKDQLSNEKSIRHPYVNQNK